MGKGDDPNCAAAELSHQQAVTLTAETPREAAAEQIDALLDLKARVVADDLFDDYLAYLRAGGESS